MKESARVLERMGVVINYAEDKAEAWPDWKVKLVLKKVECLQAMMEVHDRREAGRL